MEPLISVIVPIYKVEEYLSRCVDSIINQTYKNLEIILVDDGSPDNCPKICDDYAKMDNRIKVIHKENGGLSDARNAGMNVATGEYISFIDSDDWIENSMFEEMLNRMHEDKSDVVSCGVKWVKENGDLIRNVTVNSEIVLNKQDSLKEIINDGLLKQHVWNKLYKAEIIQEIPFEKGKYHEDVFWSYLVFSNVEKVSIITESFYCYVQRKESIMGAGYSPKRLDALDAMLKRCEYMKSNFPDLYDLSLSVYLGSCMYHIQHAIRDKCDRQIIENIKDRIKYTKTGNVFSCLKGKQVMWMKMFLSVPEATCRLRNILRIGL